MTRHWEGWSGTRRLQQKKKELSMNLSVELPAVTLIDENIIVARKSLSENVESSLENLESVNGRSRIKGLIRFTMR